MTLEECDREIQITQKQVTDLSVKLQQLVGYKQALMDMSDKKGGSSEDGERVLKAMGGNPK
tara:strand:- start:146 stop:328 length:183 start_codon:yes stop_codon:yes gene_type:complete